jgi:hypothetical protein
MKTRFYLALALGALALSACAALGPSAASVDLKATQAFVVAEQTFDTAVKGADIAINTGALSPAAVREIKTLADQGYADVKLGRAAVAAANPASIGAEVSALNALVSQIAALVPAKI